MEENSLIIINNGLF